MLAIDYESMKKKKELTLHQKAIRLIEGGFVEFDGHVVAAKVAPDDVFSCDICEMDSICHVEMGQLCGEVSFIKQQDYYLVLAENLK